MKKLFVVKGLFAADEDAAAAKRREIAERLKRGEDVNVTASGQVVQPNDSQAEMGKTLKAPEGKLATDTFVCDTCGCRMMLKILGDKTHCRADGCNGTMRRV